MQAPQGTILLVEDHEDTRLLISILLRESGYSVTSASTLTDGLVLAQSQRFNLYLLDNLLPDGTGIELCRQVRGFDPETPVVFYSGAATREDRQQAAAAGAQAYLTKPDCFDDLVQTISLLLEQTQSYSASATV